MKEKTRKQFLPEITKNPDIRDSIIVKPGTLLGPYSKFLNINEQRILFFAIYKIQRDKNTVSYSLNELSEAFGGIKFGAFKRISGYVDSLLTYTTSVSNKKDWVRGVTVFSFIEYKEGVFTFKFNDMFLPEIHRQNRYIRYGWTSIGQFKCQYTNYLYEFLKDNLWGPNTQKVLTIDDFKKVFKVPEEKYQGKNANFRTRVWKPALEEINEFTGYIIDIKTIGKGDKMRFVIERIRDEVFDRKKEKAKMFECGLGVDLIGRHCSECLRINRCPFTVDIPPEIVPEGASIKELSTYDYEKIMNEVFWHNRYYSLPKRIKNGTATYIEETYYTYILGCRNLSDSLLTEAELEEIFQEEKDFFLNTLDNY